jgi:hypothetical protein
MTLLDALAVIAAYKRSGYEMTNEAIIRVAEAVVWQHAEYLRLRREREK